jgi:phytoene dehydrogenase-like protein
MAKSNGAKANGAKPAAEARSTRPTPSTRPTRSTGDERTYDAIVVGGGHNGLTNAAYLAKAGLKTLVLERRPIFGGAAITEELRPGFWFTSFSYALSLLRPDIIHELDLVKHGFMPILMPSTFCPKEDGDYLLFGQDHGENHKEIARHSKHDADAYDAYNHDVNRVLQAIKPLLDAAPPDIFSDDPEELVALAALGSHFKKLDKKVLHDAVRLLTGSAANFLDDYFESDILKGYLASTSIIGTKVGPYSEGSGLVLLYHLLGEHDGEFGAWAFHKQGNGGFTKVLARAAEAFGVEIRLESPVEQVITNDGRATGVALSDGSEFHAPVIVSALDPRRTFLELLDPRELPTDLVETIERFRFQGTSAKVNFALDGIPRYPALGDRTDQYRGFTNIGPSMEYLERAFDDAKYGWYSKRPYLDCAIQSTVDPDMAPPGKAVMSCFVQYAPYHLRESDWDTQKQGLGDTVQATLESFFPGFGDLVLQREVRTPLDIERTVGLSEGNIFAGEFLAPQMYFFRPAPGWSNYRTPIGGYYQCGSGTHPGGCVMGAPGKLAALQVLRDRDKANVAPTFGFARNAGANGTRGGAGGGVPATSDPGAAPAPASSGARS